MGRVVFQWGRKNGDTGDYEVHTLSCWRQTETERDQRDAGAYLRVLRGGSRAAVDRVARAAVWLRGEPVQHDLHVRASRIPGEFTLTTGHVPNRALPGWTGCHNRTPRAREQLKVR